MGGLIVGGSAMERDVVGEAEFVGLGVGALLDRAQLHHVDGLAIGD